MRRAIATACVIAILTGGVWAQQPGPQAPTTPTATTEAAKKATKKRVLKKKQKAPAPAPAQPLPAQIMPPVPATLMNSAPVAPAVTMENGLLTIDAPNSTLSDVLSGVQKATGAAIEGASPTERIAVRLGPGDPEQVIAALLRGTAYNYVILGELGRKDVVTRVVLTQSSGGGDKSGASQSRAPERQPPMEDQPERTPPEDIAAQPNPNGEPEQPPRQPEQPHPSQPEQPK